MNSIDGRRRGLMPGHRVFPAVCVTRVLACAVALPALMLSCVLHAKTYSVTVTAGAFDREWTLVSFVLPDAVGAGNYTMAPAGDADTVVLQVDRQNRGWFLLAKLAAGSSRRYELNAADELSLTDADPRVTGTTDKHTITFGVSDRKVISFYHGDNDPPESLDKVYRRAGYIHPAYSPNGVPLTNHLDTQVYPHHYGIWSAWTRTRFEGRAPDFWNVQDRSGRVEHAGLSGPVWEGPVHAGLTAKNVYVDISGSEPVSALNEQWQVTVYNTLHAGAYNMFDVTVTQTADTGRPLVLPEYRYGGMSIRGNADWNDPDRVSFLTSDGYGRKDGDGARARWCHMGGKVGSRRAGIAVLSHPDNDLAPQPVRIHPEAPYFVYAPVRLGGTSIQPGSPRVMNYRYVTYDGPVEPDRLNRMWNDYAYPPGVTVIAK